jgi:CubicO group peptidase (beta-lactamase class C family)
VKDGQVLKEQGYGLASVEFGVPVNKDSVFQLYSTSKIFAGIVVMRLVQEGNLSLDAPVPTYLEGLPPAWKAIHIRHLLTHTSGLQESSQNPRALRLSEEEKNKLSAEEEMRMVAELPLRFAPGEKFAYHQSGYTLLGLIVKNRTGKSYNAFLKETLLEPLGMTSTAPGDTTAVISRRPSTAYNRQGGQLRNWVYLFGADVGISSGLNSSASDLAGFFVALHKGHILPPESLQRLWEPVRLNNGKTEDYGLGWSLDNHKGHRVVGHEGGGAAWIAHFPEDRLSIAVLCNLNGARADEIQYGIADHYLAK